MKRVGVVDYGVGNLHSVHKALEHLGARVDPITDARGVEGSDVLIMPGVGAFAEGMRALRERGLVDALRAYARSGAPLLGICLGMQFLFDRSEEFGDHEGLRILGGDVVALPVAPGTKVPHVGWNRIFPAEGASWSDTILDRIPPGAFVYFVHSFAARPADPDAEIAIARYGGAALCAAVRHGNVWGCQFHPEKSGAAALSILRRFLESPPG